MQAGNAGNIDNADSGSQSIGHQSLTLDRLLEVLSRCSHFINELKNVLKIAYKIKATVIKSKLERLKTLIGRESAGGGASEQKTSSSGASQQSTSIENQLAKLHSRIGKVLVKQQSQSEVYSIADPDSLDDDRRLAGDVFLSAHKLYDSFKDVLQHLTISVKHLESKDLDGQEVKSVESDSGKKQMGSGLLIEMRNLSNVQNRDMDSAKWDEIYTTVDGILREMRGEDTELPDNWKNMLKGILTEMREKDPQLKLPDNWLEMISKLKEEATKDSGVVPAASGSSI